MIRPAKLPFKSKKPVDIPANISKISPAILSQKKSMTLQKKTITA